MTLALRLKICCIVCALLAVPGLCTAGIVVSDGVCYRILSGSGLTAEVCGFEGHKAPTAHVRIPEKIIYHSRTYTVTSVAPGAFAEQGAPRLVSIHLPASVETIGRAPFRSCRALKRITVDAANPTFMSDGFVLLTRDRSEAVCCAPALPRGTRIFLPASVVRIRAYAFFESNLASIYMPGVVHIGPGAFAESALANVHLSTTLRTVGESAFRGTHLSKIILPEGVEKVESEAFAACLSLQQASLPASLRVLGNEAFAGCTRLRHIVLPEALTAVGAGTFMGCTALGRIDLPTALGTVGRKAFAGCTRLSEIRLPAATSQLDEQAFMGCTALKAVYIGGETANIGFQAFRDCITLQRIALSGRSTLGEDAFLGCIRIREIRCRGKQTFRGRADIWPDEVLRQATLYVPAGSHTVYTGTDPWRNFWEIREQTPETAGESPFDSGREKATAAAGQEH